jgi:Tol biopolymer transport system component
MNWQWRRRSAPLAAIALVAGLLLSADSSEASFPGQNGQIAFDSNASLAGVEIYTMAANGTDARRLTDFGNAELPSFSANGKEIVFGGSRTGVSFADVQVFEMNADGSHIKQVTHGSSPSSYPSFSPNGKEIAFVKLRLAQIWVVNTNGLHATRLGSGFAPSFSPNGKKIIYYVSNPDTGVDQVWVMDSNGSHKTMLVQNASDPVFSPNGKQVVFESGSGGLFVMSAAGGDKRRLTTSGTSPAFSPDGTKIAFEQSSSGFADEIWVMKANGSDKKRLTAAGGEGDADPNWGPSPG